MTDKLVQASAVLEVFGLWLACHESEQAFRHRLDAATCQHLLLNDFGRPMEHWGPAGVGMRLRCLRLDVAVPVEFGCTLHEPVPAPREEL